MIIKKIEQNKHEYMSLLLLADPNEDMIGKYLKDGELFALFENEKLRTVAVILDQGDGICELKNIATKESSHGRGYGSAMIRHLFEYCRGKYKEIIVGTSEPGVPFYERLGFEYSHKIDNFFVDNYPEPIYDSGHQCVDMLYLKAAIS